MAEINWVNACNIYIFHTGGFHSFFSYFELFFYNYRHCTNRSATLFKLACADFKHFSMYFFQLVAEINTSLFRSEFPVLAGYCCKCAAFFQPIIHKPDMLYILITGKRRICNNLSVTTYTVFGKVFIKQYYVVKGVKKFSVFRHQLITLNHLNFLVMRIPLSERKVRRLLVSSSFLFGFWL